MTRTFILGLVALAAWGCSEQSPTSIDETLLPGEPITVEVRLTWDEFASNLEVFGGYGSPQELGTGVLANGFADTLDARTLVTFARYPTSTSVEDSTGTTVVDQELTFLGGRLVAVLDTIASTNDGPVELALGALPGGWHASTASWDHLVDTINDRRDWEEAGAGPVVPVATTIWDPAAGDSAFFELDSARVAEWGDTLSDRSVRLDVLSEGVRLKLTGAVIQLDTRPAVNPDTTVVLTVTRQNLTFVYSPSPEPPPDGIRIGGAPAWRTVLDVDLPTTLSRPTELCAAVGCPIELGADQVNSATVVLRTRRTQLAFQPTDSVGLDVRPVLLREALPKAPLGESLLDGFGERIDPLFFGDADGAEVEIPVTQFVKDLLNGETESGLPPSRTLALLSPFEPISITFASFFGPGTPLAPELKLVITTGKAVQLP